ncbi:Soluble lytic murein transglycosylase [Oceanospirillum multiglobuliferum]|uniref:Murein transglycosylase C n=1 Tax=Oceanospirillum multiglobuliferum TaxID=64969 RepID=A0A1T4S9S6_9GAMM|nr:membrane-bound lytic murein transglycosylase MltC [Oceanospirillum multiglobuliferum]OPX54349.1 murein transglycosylase C [Oceanospirillum multiglobuliferum]SKA24937.1 Soluble lytic murein transglycosylase [Oceanospirillum multiglobuliferum]
MLNKTTSNQPLSKQRLMLMKGIVLGLTASTLLLTGCVGSRTSVVEMQAPAPKSLVPLPPPGGFVAKAPEPVSVPTPRATPKPMAMPSTPAPIAAAIEPISQPFSVPLSDDNQPLSDETPLLNEQPLIKDEPAAWLARFPALAKEYEQYKDQIEKEYRAYEQKVQQLRQKASKYWGDGNVAEPTNDKYVKYQDGYKSRGEVDFAGGNVIVETVDEQDHKQRLSEAIVETLLTPDDARDPDLFSDKNITYRGPLVLEGQVKDHDGVIVQWEWRAKRYANWLVENKLQTLNIGGKKVYRVEIPMESNHEQVRGQKYEEIVRKASQRYDVPESLIYSIMETESHFNPYATSHIPAYGLMQVVPSTAGRDVFERIKKKSGQPDRSYLFNVTNNIDTGTAYLSILDDIYLKGVTNPLSREYCVISAYNGGAGNVLKTFSSDRKRAVSVINSMSPQQVYLKLNKNHPSAESRHYIEKVVKAKQKYQSTAVASN